jgi:HK97 gp10 family phage protein
MAAGFTMKVQGLDQLMGVMKKLPVSVQAELTAEMKITADEIRDGAKRDAPVDEARVKSSISTKKISNSLFEVVAQSSYAGYLEFGTKTKVSVPAGLESVAAQLRGQGSNVSTSPFEAIQKWVKRKGIAGTFNTRTRRQSRSRDSLANIKQTAWLIWRSIRKYGIRPQPYFFKQVAPAEQRLRQRVANIIRKII